MWPGCLKGWCQSQPIPIHIVHHVFGVAAAALREHIGAPMWPVDRPAYARRVAECRAALGDATFDAAWQEGRALTWEQAANAALMLREDRHHAG